MTWPSIPHVQLISLDAFDARLDAARDEALSFAPRLFVEDGAVSACREAELRVRVVTDSSIVALALRSLLHRTPLYSPEAFPASLTVYHTRGSSGVNAPVTSVDVDARAGTAIVLAEGAVTLAALRNAVAAAAGSLYAAGAPRSVPASIARSPNLAAARADGVLGWYVRDGHVYAPPGAVAADALALCGDIVLPAQGEDSPTTLIVGGAAGGAVAAAAARAGRLLAAHHAVWLRSPPGSAKPWTALSSLWAGASLPEQAAGGTPPPRGAVIMDGSVTAPLAGAAASIRATRGPIRVVVIGRDAVMGVSAAMVGPASTSDGLAARVAQRLDGAHVDTVADEAAAVRLLGLAAGSS